MNNVRWGGVRIHDVLAAAKPHASAQALEFVSMEVPYTDYLTLKQASLRDAMLAYEMDGKPLAARARRAGAADHPGDVRLQERQVAGGINLVPQEQLGYWEQLGYDQNAWVGRSNGYGT